MRRQRKRNRYFAVTGSNNQRAQRRNVSGSRSRSNDAANYGRYGNSLYDAKIAASPLKSVAGGDRRVTDEQAWKHGAMSGVRGGAAAAIAAGVANRSEQCPSQHRSMCVSP
jgi:hypothetical protein